MRASSQIQKNKDGMSPVNMRHEDIDSSKKINFRRRGNKSLQDRRRVINNMIDRDPQLAHLIISEIKKSSSLAAGGRRNFRISNTSMLTKLIA